MAGEGERGDWRQRFTPSHPSSPPPTHPPTHPRPLPPPPSTPSAGAASCALLRRAKLSIRSIRFFSRCVSLSLIDMLSLFWALLFLYSLLWLSVLSLPFASSFLPAGRCVSLSLVGWSVGRLVGRSVGRWVGRSVGRSDDRSVGRPAKGRDRTESHNKEYKKRRAQKRESTNNSMPKVSTFVTC